MKRHLRGAILVESALVVGLIFVIVFGAIDIAIVGYDQMTADAASFASAHYNAVGVTDTTAGAGDRAANKVFPQIATSDISHPAVPQPAPSTLVPVDYGYNGTVAEKAAASTNRYGGASLMQPSLFQSTVTKTSVNVAGNPIAVVGQMIEPLWIETGLHFNVANVDPNAPTAGGLYSGDPLSTNAGVAHGSNTPPYYVGFNILRHCTEGQPWPKAGETDCGSNYAIDAINLGVAEHLDYSNWLAANAGADGAPSTKTSTSQTDGAGPDAGTTFAEASCHQRFLAAVGVFLQANPALPAVQLAAHPGVGGPLQPGINNYTGWTGFPNSLGGSPAVANAAVQTIYGWDRAVQVRVPLGSSIDSNPVSPGLGCPGA